MKKIDLTGKRFGWLLVMEEDGKDGRGEIRWRCKCDCSTEVTVVSSALRTGNTKSCGCYRKMFSKTATVKHGGARSSGHERLYAVYNDMKARTRNPNHISYRYYGALGVIICEEWLNSYEAFREWAFANGYTPDAPRGQCTLDRIDPTGNYCPENCRWVDMGVQNKNKRIKEAI